MRIFGMGIPELIIILAVILLIFGPKNLPKLGSAIGKTVKGLREGMGAGKKEAQEAVDEEVVEQIVEEDEPQFATATAASEGATTTKRRVVRKA